MKIFIFAHRGEAQEFIRQENFHLRPFLFDGLYQNDQDLLLISGEGIQRTTERLTVVCASYPTIESVVNFGTAGALSPQLKQGEIYPIRTAYGEALKGPQFHSYTTTAERTTWDCLSAKDRVLTNQRANFLSHFAPIVDRELWAIGSVCALFKLPFFSYKLISDYAGEKTDCFDLKRRAQELSQTLYTFYANHLKNEVRKEALLSSSREMSFLDSWPEDFYLTTAQRKRLLSLLKKIELRFEKTPEEILKTLPFSSIRGEEEKPKMRSSRIISALEDLLNPFRRHLEDELHQRTAHLKEVGATIGFDRDFETDHMKLQIEIQSASHFERFKKAVNELSYEEITHLLNGEFEEGPRVQ